MLALWSLATKTRSSCHCHSCLNTATKIARRSTNGTGRRRRLGAGDLFTACYSTILGTAAFLDASVKEDRRREWDRLITEVKRGIQVESAGLADNASMSKTSVVDEVAVPWRTQSPDLAWATLETTPATKPNTVRERPNSASKPSPSLPIREVASHPSSQLPNAGLITQLSVLDAHVRQSFMARATVKGNIGTRLVPLQLADMDGGFYPSREPTKPLHLLKMEEMVAMLVTRLLLGVKACSPSKAGEDHISHIRKMQERLEQYEDRRTKLPEYSWTDEKSMQIGRDQLHQALFTIGHSWTQESNPELLVAKMCYKLLICTAPPNITTYNLLLDIFTKWSQPELGQLVVDSFFNDSRFKPNQRTVHLFLLHYTKRNDLEKFQGIIHSMTAANGRDLNIRKRRLDSINSIGVQRWIASRPVQLRPSGLHEVFLPNAAVFDTMLRGYVKLGELWSALRLVYNLMENDVMIETDVFHEIVSACKEVVVANRGARLLRHCRLVLLKFIHRYTKGVSHLNFPNIGTDSTLSRSILTMEEICKRSLEQSPKIWPFVAKINWIPLRQELCQQLILHRVSDAILLYSENILRCQNSIYIWNLPGTSARPEISSEHYPHYGPDGKIEDPVDATGLVEFWVIRLQRCLIDVQVALLEFSLGRLNTLQPHLDCVARIRKLKAQRLQKHEVSTEAYSTMSRMLSDELEFTRYQHAFRLNARIQGLDSIPMPRVSCPAASHRVGRRRRVKLSKVVFTRPSKLDFVSTKVVSNRSPRMAFTKPLKRQTSPALQKLTSQEQAGRELMWEPSAGVNNMASACI